MRIGVYNRHWATAGGGERYAGGFAQALAGEHEVELLAHEPIGRPRLEERLGLDLSGTRERVVEDAGAGSLARATAGYDLLVTCSYMSADRCGARRGIYIVLFPTSFDQDLGATKRLLGRVAAPVLRRGAVELEWGRGFHLPERGRMRRYRWTGGSASLVLRAPADAAIPVALTFGPRPLAAGPAELEVTVGGEPVVRTRIEAEGAAALRFTIVGRGRDEPVEVAIASDTFVPRERLGTADDRELGVQLRSVQVGSGAASWLDGRFPWLAATQVSLDFLSSYDELVAISDYTAGWIRSAWNRESMLLYPPVDPPPPGEKEAIILAVGRFFDRRLGHSKKQLELVRAFRRLVRSGVDGWELHLVGGCSAEHLAYLEEVRREASGLPVHFHVDAPGAELRDLYAKASVFWHATGLGESERRHPHRLEHFGITTVEAMGAGAVPVVIGKGGQPEIVEDGVSGFLFKTEQELVERTRQVIEQPGLRARMAAAALERSGRFSQERFTEQAREIARRVLESA